MLKQCYACHDAPHMPGSIAAEHSVICPVFHALVPALSLSSGIWGPLLRELKVTGTQTLPMVTVDLKTKMAT